MVNSKANGTPSEIHLEENVWKDGYEKAELLNQYFQSVFLQNGDQAQTDHQKEPSLRCPHFSRGESKTTILKLDVNKALGLKQISNVLFKNSAESFSKSLSMFFNCFASKTVCPAKWKLSAIVPIS